MDDYERILLVKPEVFIYKIPPRTSNRAYRAADWNLEQPDWTGRLRVVSKGKDCSIKLEDKISGELFAKCPVDNYPGAAIESVSDSARYFVIRLQDDNGRSAFIGIGFADRSDSFDFNVALLDHFKILQKEEEIKHEPEEDKPKLDLGFKEGQTIKVNLNIKKTGNNSSSNRPRNKPSGGPIGILPPPPGGVKLPGPAGPGPAAKPEAVGNNVKSEANKQNSNDFLLDLESLKLNSAEADDAKTKSTTNSSKDNDLFGDFASEEATKAWQQF